MSKSPTGCVGKDIQFDLPNPVVELRGKIRVLIFESLERLRVTLLHKLRDPRQKAGMITVVGSDHLDLVDANQGSGIRRGRGDGCETEQNEENDRGCEDAGSGAPIMFCAKTHDRNDIAIVSFDEYAILVNFYSRIHCLSVALA